MNAIIIISALHLRLHHHHYRRVVISFRHLPILIYAPSNQHFLFFNWMLISRNFQVFVEESREVEFNKAI